MIVERVRDAGCEVLRLREVLPVESADALVIAKAQELGAILLSMNGDFADIVTYPPRKFGDRGDLDAESCGGFGRVARAIDGIFASTRRYGRVSREVVGG